MKYTIVTSEEEDVLIAKVLTTEEMQKQLEEKVQERVNEGKQIKGNEILKAYDIADPEIKAQVDAAVEQVLLDNN